MLKPTNPNWSRTDWAFLVLLVICSLGLCICAGIWMRLTPWPFKGLGLLVPFYITWAACPMIRWWTGRRDR